MYMLLDMNICNLYDFSRTFSCIILWIVNTISWINTMVDPSHHKHSANQLLTFCTVVNDIDGNYSPILSGNSKI